MSSNKFTVTHYRGDVTVKVSRTLAPIEVAQLIVALSDAQAAAYKWRAENHPETIVTRNAAGRT